MRTIIFYYFSDPERTVPFDETVDYTYDGDGCTFGSDVIIYTSMGCDTDLNGIPNGYVTLGTVTMSGPMPFPSAPTIEYSLNSDMDCVYEAVPHCWDDDITPTIPIEICGASDLDDITFSVLSGGGCVAEHTVAKPDCPDCGPPGGCPGTTYTGGSESVCSGNYMSGGFPTIDLTDPTEPLNQVIWANGPLGEPWVELFTQEPYDLPGYSGPMLNSNPASGMDELQIFFAYTICDDDADPATPPVFILLGDYEVTVEPIPDGQVTPVCVGLDSLNFYVEVELFSNAMSNTFTATNTYDSDVLTFSGIGTQLFGPYPNGSDVSVDFAIDGGCTFESETFSLGCLTTSCVTPDIIFSDTCVINPMSGAVEYWVNASITGSTVGYLFEVTNDVTDDTTYMTMFSPMIGIGPFPAPETIEVTVADYANSACSTSEVLVMDVCLLTGVSDDRNSGVSLYPNPADHSITIEFQGVDANGEGIITLYDVIGQKILENRSTLHDGRMEMSLSGLGSGIYFVQTMDENGENVKVLRFVKE